MAKRVETVKTVERRKPYVNTNGVILYRGPSALNGQPIIVVVTGLTSKSSNEKTGDMLATYILADVDMSPNEAKAAGLDDAVCGQCPMRKPCYVNLGQAPGAVHRAISRGSYAAYDPAKHLRLFMGRDWRIGSYGDPASVPFEVWEPIRAVVAMWTCYTHQWFACDQRYRSISVASVQTERGFLKAKTMGWQTFRVKNADMPMLPGEFACPASEEAGYRMDCQRCGVCSGNPNGNVRRASPVINVHGLTWKAVAFARIIEGLANGAHEDGVD